MGTTNFDEVEAATIDTDALEVGSASVDGTDIARTDITTAGTAQAGKFLSVDANLDFTGVRNGTYTGTVTVPSGGTGLKVGATYVTAEAAELNILDGVTATSAQINKLTAVTGASTLAYGTQVANIATVSSGASLSAEGATAINALIAALEAWTIAAGS